MQPNGQSDENLRKDMLYCEEVASVLEEVSGSRHTKRFKEGLDTDTHFAPWEISCKRQK